MYGECNGIDIKHIRGLWRSDAAIESLYLGQESVCSGALKSLEEFIDLAFQTCAA